MPIPFLPPFDDVTPFPPVSQALAEPNGLLMAGGNLNPTRLLSAYQKGIFPWFEEGEPILWWSPNPRCILWPEKIRIRRSLKKTIRKNAFRISCNKAFSEVVSACAEPRLNSNGTWITPEMLDAYKSLHKLEIARSVEVWQDNTLVGGLYGIRIGGLFVGESMFSRISDASKIALVHLAQNPTTKLIDCQLKTDHLISMGAEEIPRDQYISYLEEFGELEKDKSSDGLAQDSIIMV